MRFSNPLSIDDLCGIIGGNNIVKGNTQLKINGINEIHSVEPGDISFVDHPKYYEKVLNSLASVILINKDVDIPEGKAIIITEDPLDDFLKVVKHFVQFNPQKEPINTDAEIGEGTIIQPNVFIGENVKIGRNCVIHSNVSIYADTTIGDNVIIHSGSVIGGDAFYFQKREDGWKKLHSCGRTIICDDVEIGSNVTIDKGVSGDTFIGKGTKFDNLVQIGHDTHIGNHCLIGSQSAIAGCTFIDDECIIWAKSSVNKDLYIAPRTTLLALSAIDKNVSEEGQVLFGIPAIEARKKWKEMAYLKKLPELFEGLEELRIKSQVK
ncbi:UDP-3-O-(3-hydroxymyristoyl)glucosamine N-acyltransferase [Bacteroidales bacterium OttesenSCG-928-B11]|nr:UDP-3-O-(3-hydroxymyristoyl)glucosamine N-acyltransferase [Bacteroidales bacterium OttesenSCG-928-E04]MDL2311607.1 UDP-3-O-(3-hydroxymyristoyl)glucosamine N-acyltransferase [Bacteroidales bacterium OttesenSCG-928-B11]MDL2326660.1 UDP-3-O-(3-hydroxymyristoyl)glucosamine N-acyltransferase [Bacteroidales bacterium OttesenSCG-928-A14]